ncbi:MAG: pilus assembly protein CpaB [Chloroflexales bacterium]|nr:pilus assembly protein CpaB [Chloroflexales bacterium]
MRRGGLLILLIGLILIVGAVALFLILQRPGGGGIGGVGGIPTSNALPTEIPQVEVVRARVDIPANTVISNSLTLLEVISVPQSEFDPEQNFSTVNEIEGRLTLRPFRAKEAILKSALVDPGLSQQIPTAEPDRASDKAYPFVVNNITGVADQVKPGDFVDVVATFQLLRPVSTVGQAPVGPDGTAQGSAPNSLNDQTLRSTKTIVQRAQVLRIVRPPVSTEPTPEGGAPPAENAPAVDDTGQPIQPSTADGSVISQGTWTLVLAINDQEAELMEFAIASEARLVLVLRGAGDSGFEPTIGATFDLLIDQFGLPLPQPLSPYVIGPGAQLTPLPTRTPAPTRVP